MTFRRSLFFIFFTFLCVFATTAKPVIDYSDLKKSISIGNSVEILEDKSNQLTLDEVRHSDSFQPSKLQVPNLGVSPSTFWIRFTIKNSTSFNPLLLNLACPTLDTVIMYSLYSDGSTGTVKMGEFESFDKRKYNHQDYIFDLNVPKDSILTVYLKIRSGDQMTAPLYVGTPKMIFEDNMQKDLMFGLFFGILLVMFFYNLFIYFTVRDNTYLFYCIYTFFEILNLGTLYGYTFRFLWPNSVWMANNSIYLMACFADITAILFLRSFLNTKHYLPRADKVLIVLMSIFGLAALLVFAKQYGLSFGIMQLNTMIASFYVLWVTYKIYKKGYRPALWFLIAWSTLLVGAVTFVLKDFGVLPYTNLTSSTLILGSIIEVILLSFALADKINALRKEKDEMQAQAMSALEENARIINEQNVILETKVTERTTELKASNEELNRTLEELKEAEMQLVESEKMASLGQLTAGIAHEINNPINFVTSNVKPLKRDVEMMIDMIAQVETITFEESSIEEKKKKIADLKEELDYDYLKTEIDYLLKGINEGSSRTAEIVKGLRIFSRLDEDDLKKASVNEGLDSTIIIINNLLENRIEIKREYGNVPLVECYPGKLNQVFLNIITNAIHALKLKIPDGPGGVITIRTTHDEDNVFISIHDNGTGMDENTKKKLFEPFFTTKEVGEGTGLGLSIAWNTMKKHNGTIIVNSTLGEGTEFIIELPIIHQSQQ